MRRTLVVLLFGLLSRSALAVESLAVIAAGDPPTGPGPELAEMTHQLRGACRERVPGVLDGEQLRTRLFGQEANSTLAELQRAYDGGYAAYSVMDFNTAIQTFQTVVDELEKSPDSPEAHALALKAMLHLAYARETSGAGDSSELMKGGGRMQHHELYEPRVEKMRVPLADPKFELAYVSDEMGDQLDWAPEPLAYAPGKGLWLVDPGPMEAQAPSLQVFSESGVRVVKTPLAAPVKLGPDGAFRGHRLWLDAEGAFLLASRDAADRVDARDFVGVELDHDAKVRRVVPIVGLDYSNPVERGPGGTLWAHRESGSREWVSYDARGMATRVRIQAPKSAVLLQDGALLALEPGGGAVVYDAQGRPSRPKIAGKIEKSYAMVSGLGPVVGSIVSLKQASGPRRTVMQLLYVRRNPDLVAVLGTGDVPGSFTKGDETNWTGETVRPEWMHLDPGGNLYVIAREIPKKPAIVVYRLALGEEARKALRAATTTNP
jgi:hypothetical protein